MLERRVDDPRSLQFRDQGLGVHQLVDSVSELADVVARHFGFGYVLWRTNEGEVGGLEWVVEWEGGGMVRGGGV